MRLRALGLLGLILLGSGYAFGQSTKLQQTTDGTARVGRTDGGFRIVAYGADVTMGIPPGWKILLCTEQPLNAHVVCGPRDGKCSVSVNVWDASPGAKVTSAAREHAHAKAYLREMQRTYDNDIKLAREPKLALPDGRKLPVWRFFSEYWGERLYVAIPSGPAIVSVEVGTEAAGADRSMLREVLRNLLGSSRLSQDGPKRP